MIQGRKNLDALLEKVDGHIYNIQSYSTMNEEGYSDFSLRSITYNNIEIAVSNATLKVAETLPVYVDGDKHTWTSAQRAITRRLRERCGECGR